MTVVLLALGAGLLVVGARALVRGASGLASALRISPLVIGLTVVAFGTSAPEMAVSVDAAMRGRAEIAVGNVIGSNILNVLLILGVCAVIAPLAVSRPLARIDTPIMIVVSLGLVVMCADGAVGRLDGVVLLAGLVAYTAFVVRRALATRPAATVVAPVPWPRGIGLALVGLGALILGSRWFVEGASGVARAAGVSEFLIGATIVAIGTSLPELATSIAATVRGERDIAVGNVVGSNIFNILGVMGASGLAAADGVAAPLGVVGLDAAVMLGAAVVALPMFLSDGKLSRAEGAFMLAAYAGYVAMAIALATGDGSRDKALLYVATVTGFAMVTAGARAVLKDGMPSTG